MSTAIRSADWTQPTTQPGQWTRCSWTALGTTAVLCVHGPGDEEARAAVQREIDAIDIAASRFRDDSELSHVNRDAGRRVRVSPLFLEAMQLALRAAVLSDGAVDPTLGDSLVEIGYDRDWSELPAVPLGSEPEPARPRVVARRRGQRWRDIRLRDDPPSVELPAGVRLDLGATAKALAADKAAQAAHLAAGGGVLVSLGGDIATCGSAPNGGWMIHVTDDHRDTEGWLGQTIALHTGALATSSVVARRWTHEGRVRHHILDPRRGTPVRPIWRTVSVAAASCAEANIASTASIVLGSEAPGWLDGHGLPARLVAVDGSVRLQGGWPR